MYGIEWGILKFFLLLEQEIEEGKVYLVSEEKEKK